MKAIVDSREPQGVKSLFKVDFEGDFEAEVSELDQADFYLPEYDVAIERKEGSDFVSSTTEGRLSEQADRMKANHDYNFLILEGSPYEQEYSDVAGESLLGMQTSLAVKRGFHIIFTKDEVQTLYAVRRIFQRFMDEEHERVDSGYVKTHDTGEVDNIDAAMISQVEGVSTDKALEISDKLSVHDIAWQVTCERGDTQGVKDELMNVDGVGSVLAQRVIDAFQ